MNPFWKSRKFNYTLATLLTAVILAVVPEYIGMSADSVATLQSLLPGVFAVGIALVTGHTITDAVALWSDRPKYKDIKDALKDVVQLATEDEEVLKMLRDFLHENGVNL